MRNHRIVLGVLALLAASVCAAPAQATGRGKGVNFPVSCSAGAQQAFNEALAALHSFWYAQAAKEFRAIAEREPDCAMAHWGYAMSHWTQLWAPPRQDALDAGLASLRRAGAVTNKSQRESDFVAAALAFFGDNDKLDHRTRLAAYASAIDRVGRSYPDDREMPAMMTAYEPLEIIVLPDITYIRIDHIHDTHRVLVARAISSPTFSTKVGVSNGAISLQYIHSRTDLSVLITISGKRLFLVSF